MKTLKTMTTETPIVMITTITATTPMEIPTTVVSLDSLSSAVTLTVALHSLSSNEPMVTEQELSMVSRCNWTEMEASKDNHAVIIIFYHVMDCSVQCAMKLCSVSDSIRRRRKT